MVEEGTSCRRKILVTMIGFPFPPVSGGQLRDYNLLKSLSEEFEIHLLVLANDMEVEKTAKDEINKICRKIEIIHHEYGHSLLLYLQSILRKIPYKVLQFNSGNFRTRVKNLLENENFDILFCDHIYLTDNLPDNISIPVIPHTEDAFSFLYKQVAEQAKFIRKIYASFQWKILSDYEIKIFRKYGIFIAVSEEEKKRIGDVLPDIKIPIIPNGIDLNYFNPQDPTTKELNLVFVGLMDSFPNEDAAIYFVKDIFPLVLKKNKEIKFFIVGKNPTEKVLSLHDNKNIFVTGTVDDVRPFIAQAIIYVVPLRFGTGTRLKILEAMSMRIPVVSTSIGCEGLNAGNNKDIIISDTPDGFATAINALIDNLELRQNIAAAGRKLAEGYSWDSIGKSLNNFLCTLITN